ncbi:hypothetical protein R4Y59_002717, partial [Enterococcus faecalis]|nr:hypothetical protein [Enterococcus faecalis]
FSSIFLLIKSNEQKDESIFSGSNQSVIEFSAILTEEPKQVEQTDRYYISFDNVQTFDEENKKNLNTFKEGGKLIFTLPLDKKIEKGDKIVVRMHRHFATTHSIPPQIIGNSVTSVSF